MTCGSNGSGNGSAKINFIGNLKLMVHIYERILMDILIWRLTNLNGRYGQRKIMEATIVGDHIMEDI
jgi:hypothetical protein